MLFKICMFFYIMSLILTLIFDKGLLFIIIICIDLIGGIFAIIFTV